MFQAAIDVTGQIQAPDSGVVIQCSDDHLTIPSDGFNGVYFDNSDGRQAQIRGRAPVAGATGPCKDTLRAFAYPFGFASGSRPGGIAVILCSNWAGGAITSTETVSGEVVDWRVRGDLRTASQGIEVLGRYLSQMIIHELMHAGNMLQCRSLDRTSYRYRVLTIDLVPAALPDGNINELYGYSAIAGHAIGETGGSPPTANNRQHNADSFAFLASGMFYLLISLSVNKY
jgi:hypothetical protein